MKRDIRNEIVQMMKRNSYGVTIQEVINELGIAPMTAKRHLGAMEFVGVAYAINKGNVKIYFLRKIEYEEPPEFKTD